MNISPELLNVILMLIRMASAALARNDNQMAQKIAAIAEDTIAGYEATGRIDERTAAFVRENGEFLDQRPAGRLTEAEWKASAEQTRAGIAAWNSAG